MHGIMLPAICGGCGKELTLDRLHRTPNPWYCRCVCGGVHAIDVLEALEQAQMGHHGR